MNIIVFQVDDHWNLYDTSFSKRHLVYFVHFLNEEWRPVNNLDLEGVALTSHVPIAQPHTDRVLVQVPPRPGVELQELIIIVILSEAHQGCGDGIEDQGDWVALVISDWGQVVSGGAVQIDCLVSKGSEGPGREVGGCVVHSQGEGRGGAGGKGVGR